MLLQNGVPELFQIFFKKLWPFSAEFKIQIQKSFDQHKKQPFIFYFKFWNTYENIRKWRHGRRGVLTFVKLVIKVFLKQIFSLTGVRVSSRSLGFFSWTYSPRTSTRPPSSIFITEFKVTSWPSLLAWGQNHKNPDFYYWVWQLILCQICMTSYTNGPLFDISFSSSFLQERD